MLIVLMINSFDLTNIQRFAGPFKFILTNLNNLTKH